MPRRVIAASRPARPASRAELSIHDGERRGLSNVQRETRRLRENRVSLLDLERRNLYPRPRIDRVQDTQTIISRLRPDW